MAINIYLTGVHLTGLHLMAMHLNVYDRWGSWILAEVRV